MNKIKRDNFNIANNFMSNSNITVDKNSNPLNIPLTNQSQKNTQEEPRIPKNIGPYEIITKIIDGCYSKIYLGKSKYTGDNVCLKLIEKISFQENVEDLLLATRQIESLKILKHRNILSLFEIYESPKFIILVTEYLSGKELIEHLIAKKRFNEEEAKKIFYQLIDALYYMHQMNICHRDIRTEHIMFDKNKTPKIVGFSYSSFYNKINNKNQKLNDSFGSLCYACPEIIQEMAYDPELADVWSIGVVLYAMVSGYLPFCEEDDEKTKDLITEGKLEFPNEMTNKLKDLLKHMLDINSEKRYNFSKIIKHPWFKPYNEIIIGGCNIHKMIYPIDEKILNIIKIYDFNKKQIENDMKNNKFNIGTGLYRHLVIKLKEMGFTSLSDLSSKEYCNYKNEKKNFHKDGDERYNTYLIGAQTKIEKIEKFISDFQEKEESIINQLNQLEDTNNMPLVDKNLSQSNNNSNNNDKNNNGNITENIDKTEKNNKLNNNNIFNNCPKEKKENQNEILKQTNKKKCHKRTLTPIFEFKEFEDNEIDITDNNVNDENLNTEIGHINKEEMEIINKSKKAEKRKSILFNQEQDIYLNGFENNKKIKRCQSFKNPKNLVKKLLDFKIKPCKKHRNSQIVDSHYITSSTTKWLDTSMVIKRKKNYLNCSSFLDKYLKKPHQDNSKKNEAKNNILNDINKTIIEENNNSIINNSQNNNSINNNNKKNNAIRKSKQIRYSLSFNDDDEEDESSYISKIDSKQLSVFDDEEIKAFRELGLVSKAKSPNIKVNNNSNNNSGNNNNNNECNVVISNFSEKNKNCIQSNSNKNMNIRNSKIEKKIENKNDDKCENPIINLCDNKAEISFHEDNFNNNINKNIKIENNKVENIPIIKSNTYNISKKQEKKEINIYYNDKKKLSKLNIFNKNEIPSISVIDNRERNKYSYSYFKDLFTIKKLENICQIKCSILDIDKFIPHKKEKSKKNIRYFNRNVDNKISQRKTLDVSAKTKKEKNMVILENNNTTRKNAGNSKIILGKNSNLKNNKNGLTDKKYKKRESSLEHRNNNKASMLGKENNEKIVKNLDNEYKNKEKNKSKKKSKSKFKSDLSSKYHEDLNFTNMSDLSEIRTLSILSPSYMNNTNVENKMPNNIYENKENMLLSNILPTKSTYISFDKSFQSLYQNQNKSRFQNYNLSVSHENNIACLGRSRKNTKEKKKIRDNLSMTHFPNKYNGVKKIKRLIDCSNSNINLEESNNISNSHIFTNYENYSHRIYEYDKSRDNNYLNKNSLVSIKKRNLAEKLKEEIQKSKKTNKLYSSPSINNGRMHSMDNSINNDLMNNKDRINDDYINNNNNSLIFNGDIPQSNGKKIRDKFIRSSSILAKNNISENNRISKNSNTLTKNYNNNIPLRLYDLNSSRHSNKCINIINPNNSINNYSLNSINNQAEEGSGNYGQIFINSKDISYDYLLNCLLEENKIEENQQPKRRSTIKIKKKLSNSVKSNKKEERNNSVNNHIITMGKSKKKSNGKTNYQNYINNNHFCNCHCHYCHCNKNKNTQNNNILLKSIKHKFLNGKIKDEDVKNNNMAILSKNIKNNGILDSDQIIICSLHDLNICENNQNTNQLLSNLLLPKNQNNNKITNQKSSINKANYQYKKVKSMNITTNAEANKARVLCKNKPIYKNENNNVNLRSSMDLNNNIEKNKKKSSKIDKDDNINRNNNYGNAFTYKKQRKKSGCYKNVVYNY